MIEVTNLVKHYGDKKAVNDISFFIDEGEVVGFLGPNGAGKSTTMNIVTGYLSATSGSVKIAGIDILEDPIPAKKRLGYLPENPPLYFDMTVKEYLNFVYELKGCRGTTQERNTHIGNICEIVGIDNVFGRMTRNLSKGYKQRVGLAQALVGDPDVLILDEPTVGLDPIQIIEIRNVIKDLGKKRTVILSSHILSEVQQICGRVLVINKGKLIANDTPDNLSRTVESERRYNLRVSGNPEMIVSVLKGIDGMKSVTPQGSKEYGSTDYLIVSRENEDVRQKIFMSLEKANLPVLQLTPVGATLEDIFIKLTGQRVTEDEGRAGRVRRSRKKGAANDVNRSLNLSEEAKAADKAESKKAKRGNKG
ncbi:MAG: ATP-binding cassette domain-containing protein [Clostridia bacterium]|nr:ATP-binding cassette domain-containing protein [Clostridia bacterium]